MISKSLSTSEKFAGLVSMTPLAEFCHALYPLIVSHSDDFGRLQGDLFTVKHQCYPASSRTLEEFGAALQAMHEADLLIWYVAQGKRFVQIVQFEKHQQGLHKRTKSQFPRVPGNSGNDEELPGQLKRTEENLTKQKKRLGTAEPSPDVRPAFEHYHQLFLKRYHGKPTYAGEKDGARMKRLLKEIGLLDVKSRLAAFFLSADPWIQKSGHTLDVFFSAGLQTKLVAEMGSQQRSEWACPHSPPCPVGTSATKCDLRTRLGRAS